MQTEWIHTLPPKGLPVEIFDQRGQVRSGISDGAYVHLTDCRLPEQNAICPHHSVVAWRADDKAELVPLGNAAGWACGWSAQHMTHSLNRSIPSWPVEWLWGR